MKQPTTQQVVAKIVEDYQRAGRALARAEKHNGALQSWMNQDTMDQDAAAIQAAYDRGDFDNVPQSDVESLMSKYGASDIYHLTASYFTATGRILNVQ